MPGASDYVYVGQRMRYDSEFRTLSGVATDPALVRLLARRPSGGTEIYNFPGDVVTKTEPGFYRAEFVVDEAGTWHFRWEAAGNVDAILETQLEVYPSGVLLEGE